MHFNVLVVDDSAVMRAMIVRTLRMTGLPLGDVHEAANGAEALDLLRQAWVDLMLLDINMPIMNGEQVIAHLRADPETADLRIVVVSTEGSDTRVGRLADQGVAFVHKPFTPEQLRDTVLRVTGIPHEQAAAALGARPGDDVDF